MCYRCNKIFINNKLKRHLEKKYPCKTKIESNNVKELQIELLKAQLEIEKLKNNSNVMNISMNNNNNNNNTNNINNNIQYNTIALTPNNFNVDNINVNNIANEEIGLSDIIRKGTLLPDGKSNYVCTDPSRLTYNRLAKDGKWELDPKGQYLKTYMYPKIAEKVEKVYDNYKINNICYTYDQLMDLLISKSKMIKPSDDFYEKALKRLGPKVYVSRKNLKDYLNT